MNVETVPEMPDIEEIGRALFGYHYRQAFMNWFCINDRALRRGVLRQRDFAPRFWSDVIAALELCAECGPDGDVKMENGTRAERNALLAELREDCVRWRDHLLADQERRRRERRDAER